jgi:hypothetical protein
MRTNHLIATSAAFALGCLLHGGRAQATTIGFDPDGSAAGNDPYQVSTFDYLPGNALFKSIGSLLSNKSGQPAQHFVQARLGNLLDANGDEVPVVGLGSTFEITVVVGFDASVNVSGLSMDYSLASSPNINFFKIYYDSIPDASDLLGTGFSDGTLILSGSLIEGYGTFLRNTGTDRLFDSFGTDNYAGKQTKRGTGAGDFTIDIATWDPNFFVNLNAGYLEFFNTSNITPFNQANPSARFYNGSNTFVPNLGLINGDGTDFQSQADANASFFVPEPSAVAVTLLGGLVAAARRRRR